LLKADAGKDTSNQSTTETVKLTMAKIQNIREELG
jgi:hypothetical protein